MRRGRKRRPSESKQQVCIQRADESITYDGERVRKQKEPWTVISTFFPAHTH